MKALVLTGGGAKGAWQAGVMKALHERGERYDMIVGTSVGAINGAGYSFGGVDRLISLWTGITSMASALTPPSVRAAASRRGTSSGPRPRGLSSRRQM